ncbi:carboxypeptidase-like regulatory domain-containing protein, partial [Marinilabilia sp.]
MNGVIVNETKQPVEGVQVLVIGTDKGTTSDRKGIFSIDASEQEVLEFSHVSYESVFLPVSQLLPDTIVLKAGVNRISEITVLPFNVTDVVSINSKNIESLPVLLGENDVLKYAGTLPGIKSLNALDGGLYVRGGSGFDNAFYVNDINVANPRHITGILSTYDPYIIGYSEVFKSGFPASYNGALASYINMHPTDYFKDSLSGEIKLGLLSSSLRTKIKLGRNRKALAALSYRNSYFQYAGKVINKRREDNKIPEYSFRDLTFTLKSPINENWDVQLFGITTADDLPLIIGERTRHNLNWNSQSFVASSYGQLGVGEKLSISFGGNRFHSGASSRSRVDVFSSGDNTQYS